jgi:CDP-diacylglycerol--glycerol-3-phosphate 3-phosphatidyltransferase
VSYSKARAEGLGMTANVGIAERADRLLAVLLAAFLVGVGVSVVLLVVVLALLSLASLVTVVQRMIAVRRQTLARTPDQHTPGLSAP